MRKFFEIVLACLAVLSFAACEKNSADKPEEEDETDYIVDWGPVEVIVEVVDDKGNDLLNPNNPDNMIEGSTISFRGKVYEALLPSAVTKEYLAIIEGFLLRKYTTEEGAVKYRLVFGEIDGAKDMDEDLVVTLPDGTTGTIHYHCSDHHGGKHPSCDRSWTFNGVKNDNCIFTFKISR